MPNVRAATMRGRHVASERTAVREVEAYIRIDRVDAENTIIRPSRNNYFRRGPRREAGAVPEILYTAKSISESSTKFCCLLAGYLIFVAAAFRARLVCPVPWLKILEGKFQCGEQSTISCSITGNISSYGCGLR